MTENVVDFNTQKPVKPDMPDDVTAAQWLRIWAKYAKDNQAQTVAIIGVDCEGFAFCDIIGVKELDLLKIWREVKYLREMIDSLLEPQIDVELDDDDEGDET